MSKLRGLALAVVVLWISGDVWADGNCPPGYYEIGGGGATGCAAYPTSSGPPDPGPAWSTRWGAIATANGAFGVANDASSLNKAKNAALKQCKAKGGKDCGVSLSFANQCAALAWGAGGNISKYASDIAQAEAKALQACDEFARDCKVFYSACSYPQRIR